MEYEEPITHFLIKSVCINAQYQKINEKEGGAMIIFLARKNNPGSMKWSHWIGIIKGKRFAISV